MGLEGLGKLLIGARSCCSCLAELFLLLGRLGMDRLPGDLVFRRGNATFYFPIGLMILLSVVGTIVLNISSAARVLAPSSTTSFPKT